MENVINVFVDVVLIIIVGGSFITFLVTGIFSGTTKSISEIEAQEAPPEK